MEIRPGEAKKIRIPKGAGGVGFLPLLVMEKNHLIEKHAKQAGIDGMEVEWINIGGPAVVNDALLSTIGRKQIEILVVESNPADTRLTKEAFKAAGLTVMGGVPTNWRTLNSDSKTDPLWAAVYRSFDVLSPWAVGRYSTDAGADGCDCGAALPAGAAGAEAGFDGVTLSRCAPKLRPPPMRRASAKSLSVSVRAAMAAIAIASGTDGRFMFSSMTTSTIWR